MTRIEGFVFAVRSSKLLRLCMVGILGLVLLIPVAMIGFLVSERHDRRDAAVAEVSEKWGKAQTVTGPALVLPYTVRRVEVNNGREVIHTDTRQAVFLPKRLRVTGRIESEMRSRGIFSVPVYTANFSIDGEFGRPNLPELGIDPASVAWSRAHLAIGITDVRAIREQSAITWNGSQASFLPGTDGFIEGSSGIHTVIPAAADDSGYKFAFPLSLNGSVGLYLTPFAEE